MIATNDVLYHGPERRPLQDVLTCIREKCSITQAGLRLEANAERHLKSPAEMARLFSRWPDAVARTAQVAERIGFDLGQLKYEYPDEPVPPGKSAIQHLTDLAWAGAAWRYPEGSAGEGEKHPSPRARPDRGTGLPQLFPHRPRHRQMGQGSRDSLPGPRLGGQFRRLLLPGRHLGRSHQARPRPPLRPLHLQGARRAARHRRRFRARAARAGHAICLRTLWPRAGGHLRHGDPLPPPQRHPRCRQGVGTHRGCHRRPGGHGVGKLGRRPARRPHPPGRARSGQSPDPPRRRPGDRDSRLSPPPVAACRRLRAHQAARWTRPCPSATPR